MYFNMSPWQMMRRMQEDMDQVFGQLFGGSGGPPATAGQQTGMQIWSPSVDISENDREWTIEAELPGVKEEDIQVTVQDQQLVLRAEMRQEEGSPSGQAQQSPALNGERPDGGGGAPGPANSQTQGSPTQQGQAPQGQSQQRRYFHRERRYGFFERVFPLPQNADEEHIRCEFRNGVLTLHIPKEQNVPPQGRRIPIMSGAQGQSSSGNERMENRGPAMAGAKGGEAATAEQKEQVDG
jgi:HSP20 family protein